MNLQEELVKFMKESRESAMLSQKWVAEQLNISAPQFNLYENNKRPVTVELFYNWCKAIGKKPQNIFGKIYEKEHPRSHTSKAKRLARLQKKPYGELTDEEKRFLESVKM